VKPQVVIQHSRTGSFLTEDGQWVREVEQARTFPSTFKAMDYCYAANLRETQVVMRMGERRFDCVFKVNLP
jgi:hypothetical protein